MRRQHSSKKARWRTGRILFLAALGLLVALRLMLPFFVVNYVNKTLNRIPEYRGHIDDVDIALIRGAYTIEGLTLTKISGGVPVPLLAAPNVDLSVQWLALFQGKVVGEIEFNRPVVNLVYSPSPQKAQLRVDNEWLQVVKDLFPLRINRLRIINGDLHYRDYNSEPKVDLFLNQINLIGKNFNNSRTPSKTPATIEASAVAQDQGQVKVKAEVVPAAARPTFSTYASIEDLSVTKLNDFLRAYLNVDAESGNIRVYTEMKVRDAHLDGYVKPLITDLSLISLHKDATGPLHLIWETLIAGVAEIFTNHRYDQIATTVRFSGKLGKTETDFWPTFVALVKNAFVRALKPGPEKEVFISNDTEGEK